jgi:Tol biopolymer transport system component
MKHHALLLHFLLFISLGAYTQSKDNLSPIFDISPDNKNLVISMANGSTGHIYLYSLADQKLTRLTKEEGYFSRPVFSSSGERILFLSKNLQNETSDLYIMDLSGGEIKKLTDGTLYITEGTFMPGDKEIIYCGAGIITNYSPMARRAPHDIDLYSLNLNGGTAKKLTNFKAYEFSDITPTQKGDSVLCKLIIKGVEGIYLVSLVDTGKTKIEAVNNPRPGIGDHFYGTPAISKDNSRISFTAPYQLYMLDLSDRKCKEIWSTFGKDDQAMPIYSRFAESDQKIYFAVLPIINRQYARSAQLFVYDVNTGKSKMLSILK